MNPPQDPANTSPATSGLALAPRSAAWDPAATPGCYAISEAALREYNDLGSGFVAFVPGGRGERRVNDCVEYVLKELTRLRETVRTLERKVENQGSHIAAYAQSLDGLLTPAQQAAIGGSGIDGYRDARNLRRIVEGLLSPNVEMSHEPERKRTT